SASPPTPGPLPPARSDQRPEPPPPPRNHLDITHLTFEPGLSSHHDAANAHAAHRGNPLTFTLGFGPEFRLPITVRWRPRLRRPCRLRPAIARGRCWPVRTRKRRPCP